MELHHPAINVKVVAVIYGQAQRTQQAAGNGPVEIQAKGRYRDAVRSTQGTVVKCYGLKWISLMRLVPLPWSPRPWALPFLTVLAPSARANTAAKRRHKTTVDWTGQAVKAIWREVLTAD